MPTPAHPSFSHRLDLFMHHIPRYWIDGGVRLAEDAGISSGSVYHLLNNRYTPTYRIAIAIADAIGRQLGKELHPAELFSFSGEFRTPSVCTICNCQGCLPERAYNPDGSRKPEYRTLQGGDWHLADQFGCACRGKEA